MTAPTSPAFVADLPEMSAEQLSKMHSWGHQCCTKFDVHMKDDNGLLLVCVRKKTGTVREHMRNLRTCLRNWEVELPVKMTAWLRLVTDQSQGDEEVAAKPVTDDSDAASSAKSSPRLKGDAEPERCVKPIRTEDGPFFIFLELPKNLLSNPAAFAALHDAPCEKVAVH